jgi:hypothetical protein
MCRSFFYYCSFLKDPNKLVQQICEAIATVASRLKILQNNSKPAVEKSDCPEDLAVARPPFWTKAAENRPKKYFLISLCFHLENFLFSAIFFKNIVESIFQGRQCSCLLHHL